MPNEIELAPVPADSARAALLAAVRPIALDLGVRWMVKFTAHHGVESLSQLPDSLLVGILNGDTALESAMLEAAI